MKDRGNTLPRWLQKAGYRTALIGKWLNGYGARDAHGEVPKGFDIWRGLLDVSAYDYFNFVMNIDGEAEDVGRRRLRPQARRVREHRGHAEPTTRASQDVLDKLTEVFGPAPYTYWGTDEPEGLLARRDRQGHREARRAPRAKSKKPFFIWWAPAAPHREDVATTLMGRPGADPRPAPRYAERSKALQAAAAAELQRGRHRRQAVEHARQRARADATTQIAQLQLDYEGRDRARCSRSTTTSRRSSRSCSRPTSSRTR